MTLRVLIVDDEPVARRRLRRLLRDVPDVEVAGESGDGRSAVTDVRALVPDVVLLDVQMPEMDGFEVIGALAGGPPRSAGPGPPAPVRRPRSAGRFPPSSS